MPKIINPARNMHKLERQQARIIQNYGKGATASSVRQGYADGSIDAAHHQQSRRLREANKPASSTAQDRLRSYKATRAKAAGGTGAFTFNGRARQLTDDGVVTINPNGTTTKGIKASTPRMEGKASSSPRIGGQATSDPKLKGKMNLAPGGAATQNLTQQMTETATMAGKNIKDHVAAKYNGNVGAFLGKSALQGAVWGGAVGGTISASQGGDFWAGAKEGAFKGAVGMAGWNSLRAATKTEGMFDVGNVAANSKNMWQHHQRVSKPVRSITQTAQNSATATQVMNTR